MPPHLFGDRLEAGRKVCDGRVSVPVRTLDRCAAVVFVGGMSVAVRPFDRSAGTACAGGVSVAVRPFDRSGGTACAGGVSVAVGAADPSTGTFSVDDATRAALSGAGASPTGDPGRELRAASLFSNGGA